MTELNDRNTTEKRPRYHSRHIPEKYLAFDTPMARDVKRNGLCDTLDPDSLRRLRDQGIELIETRLAWWELEPEPGRLDWSRLEKDIERIKHAGMKAGVFPWFQHPPEWYNEGKTTHVRYRCLEHNRDSTILSLWDPKTIKVYDRLYSLLAERLGDRLDFVYVGISGDFGEVCFPSGVEHYRFSPSHNHHGFWSGDVWARRSFRDMLRKKYGDLNQINTSWNKRFTDWQEDLMPELPFKKNALMHRRDFMQWYTDSLIDFTDRTCRLFRHYFPSHPAAIPIGFPDETLCIGQIKSAAIKTAARYGLTARWTGMGYLKSFPHTNMLARRVASAAHFYKASFGNEAALILEKENMANALYECLANGSSMIHDDPQNIERAVEVHGRLRSKMVVDSPRSTVCVFYPLETEMLEASDADMARFVERGASLRQAADFDICDSIMVRDGFLEGKKDLLFLVDTMLPKDVASITIEFADNGGRIWLFGKTMITILDGNTRFEKMVEKAGCRLFTTDQPREKGVYRCEQWPKFEPYSSLRKAENNREVQYITVHEKHISRYIPERSDIVLVDRIEEKS